MKKVIATIFVFCFVAFISCVAYANPSASFSDVPATHWSYEAVTYLAQNGMIDGYDGKEFQGDKTLTRYEMAQIVAKAMIKQDKASIVQKAVLDKLAAEYAMEMTQIKQLDTRLQKVEKNQPNIKLNGVFTMQNKTKIRGSSAYIQNWTRTQYALRINGSAKVDDDTSLGFRIASPALTDTNFKASSMYIGGYNASATQLDRAFITTKVFDGLQARVGQQGLSLDPEDVIIDSNLFNFMGAKLNWTWDKMNFEALQGNFCRGVTGYAFDNRSAADYSNLNVRGFKVSSNVGNLKWMVGTATFSKVDSNTPALLDYYYTNLQYPVAKNLTLVTEYGKNKAATSGGKFWLAKATIGDQILKKKGDSQVNLQYLNGEKNAINYTYTSQDGLDEGFSFGDITFNVNYNYALSSNKGIRFEYARGKAIGASQPYTDALSFHYYRTLLFIRF